jgi:undecaprenyl-diphosphatase
MNSLSVALAVGVVVWQLAGRRAGFAAFGIGIAAAIVIGASRVYLGDHYLTDVVGGYAAAILWVGLVVAAFRPAGWRGRGAAREHG